MNNSTKLRARNRPGRSTDRRFAAHNTVSIFPRHISFSGELFIKERYARNGLCSDWNHCEEAQKCSKNRCKYQVRFRLVLGYFRLRVGLGQILVRFWLGLGWVQVKFRLGLGQVQLWFRLGLSQLQFKLVLCWVKDRFRLVLGYVRFRVGLD